MVTRIYKLYGSTASTANALAQIVFQAPGMITAVALSAVMDSLTDNSTYIAELSFANVIFNTTNDPIGPIAEIRDYNNVNAASTGQAFSAQQLCVTGLAIPVDIGTRIYLNAALSGTLTMNCSIFIYVLQR